MPKLMINENTTEFCLEIKSYPKYADSSKWCDIRIAINNYYLHFDKTEELLEKSDVDKIAQTLKSLLNGNLKKDVFLNFTEPEICMHFYTAYKIERGDKDVYGLQYIGEVPECHDISMQIKIHFPTKNGGYYNEYWSVSLERRDIEDFYNQWLTEMGENSQTVDSNELDQTIKLCSCSFSSYGKTYYYQTDDDTIAIGDAVKVPVGNKGKIAIAVVENIEYVAEKELPFSLKKIKKIIAVEYRMQRQIPKELNVLFNAVKEQIDKYDAYALLESGCPSDEFDIESSKITAILKKGMSIEKIAQIMATVMCEQFDNSFKAEQFIEGATQIKKILDSL